FLHRPLSFVWIHPTRGSKARLLHRAVFGGRFYILSRLPRGLHRIQIARIIESETAYTYKHYTAKPDVDKLVCARKRLRWCAGVALVACAKDRRSFCISRRWFFHKDRE